MLAGVILLTSCATTGASGNSGRGPSAPNSNSRLQSVVNSMIAAKPEKGDVYVIDVNESDKNTFTASPFYAASIYMMLDEKFNFSEMMSDSQKVAFTQALVAGLEDTQESKDVRAIVLGKYFSDSSELNNMYIIISKVQLKAGVVPNANFAYQFTTNAMLSYNNETGEYKAMCTGTIMNSSLTYNFLAVPFEDGMLVTAGNLNLGSLNYNAEMSLSDKGNLMDTFAKDEVVENDVQIESIYNEIINSNDDDLDDAGMIVKYALAPLNYGLYLGKQGKIDEARDLWNNIDLSKIPGETESQKNTLASMQGIFTNDIPNYLLIMSEF